MSDNIVVVTLAAISALNLTLLLGIARRLNQLAESGGATAVAVQPGPSLPAPGTKARDFTAVAADGVTIGRADLVGRGLAAFFITGCRSCARLAPEFETYAATFPGGREQVLAVVVRGKGEPDKLAEPFGPVARVVVEPAGGPVSTAFGIDDFPVFCVLQDHVVIAAEVEPARLRKRHPGTDLPALHAHTST